MTLSCDYDLIKYPFFLGDISRQTTIDTRLNIPNTLPRINQVKGGSFRVNSLMVIADDGRVVVAGVISPHVIYMASAAELKDPEAQEDYFLPVEYSYGWENYEGVAFEENIEVPGLSPDNYVEVDYKVISATFERDGDYDLVFHGKLELTVHTATVHTEQVIKEIQPPGRINAQKEQVMIEDTLELKKANTTIQASLVLPNLKPNFSRILDYKVRPTSLNYQVSGEKVAIKGFLEYAVVYVGCDDDGRPTEIFVNEWNQETGSAVPFEVVFNIENKPGQLTVMPKVLAQNLTMEIKNEREISCKMDLEGYLKISRVSVKELIVEATPSGGEIVDTEKQLLSFEEFFGDISGEIPVDSEINLPFGLPGIERILSYQATPGDLNLEVSEGKILVDGHLNLSLIYIAEGTDNQRLAIGSWEGQNSNGVPVAGIIDFAGLQPGALLRSQAMIDNVHLEMTGERTLRVTGTIKVYTVAKTPRAMMTLRNCALVVPVDPATRPCMLFYLVQPGDTLWKIARRYNTTVEALARVNQISSPDKIGVGMKLLIPKRVF